MEKTAERLLAPLIVSTACLAGITAPARAATPQATAEPIEELVVYGRAERLIGQAGSASEGLVGYDDIRLPPILRVGELVEAVPGMVATQHSGTGKANQYFIRGFNLDHGTDFSVSVEGVPINLRSHGHGQGYLDLNFLIPELVETTRYRRGPYSAQEGDFSSAASVDFNLYDQLDERVLSATIGEYDYYRGLAAGSVAAGNGKLTGAVDITGYEGPWELPEDLDQLKFFGAFSGALGDADVRFTAQGYDSQWNATDQIPERAVGAGLISPLGYIDGDLGGETSRYALTGLVDFGAWSINAYAVDYDFTLYSNFTYFLDDPLNGDQFEQRDKRRIYGLSIRGGDEGAPSVNRVTLRWGGDVRYDDIDEVGLYGTSDRVRTDIVRQDQVKELSLDAWAEAEWSLTKRLRTIIGLRADWYDWEVNARRDANSGSGDDAILSPKATLAWRFTDHAEAYLNAGRGFHSNDVRGGTIGIDPVSGDPVDGVPALVRSDGAELGLRFEQGRNLNATLTLFWLELDSELVYVGDAGSTEPNGATERIGFEGVLFWQVAPWLAVNAAYTNTDAKFKEDAGGGREIPGAVESTFTLGANGAWENGLSASARLRWLGEAPLAEDGSVHSEDSLLVNAGVAYRLGSAELRLDVFNLFDSTDYDISYYYASRLGSEPLDGVEDLHFHPLEPRSVRGTVTWYWD